MENNVLIRKARNGDDDAFKQLLKNHHNMIFRIINNCMLDRGDFSIDKDELYQEASVVLYRAIFTFEEDKNVKFSSYVYVLVRNRIFNLIRDYTRLYKEESYSLDVENNYENFLKYTANDNPVNYHKEEEFKRYLGNFIETLNTEDREILRLRNEQYSYKDISRIMNIHTKRIDNRLASLRKRFNNYLDK